jgi:hypothetical protein
MHTALEQDNYPQVCFDVGKECDSCVQQTAAESAKVCPGASGRAVTQLFVLLYPNIACAPMAKRFAQAYRDAPGELEGRKPNTIQGVRVKIAVA